MHKEDSLVLDGICEITDLLRPWAKDVFYDFGQIDTNPDYVYVIGRKQLLDNRAKVRAAIDQGIRMVYSNPFEGSDTLRKQMIAHGMNDLFVDKKMLVIGGGDMDPEWPCLRYDLFLPKTHDFEENIEACARTQEIFACSAKPKNFLFLNGRGRPHRKWLLEYFYDHGLLDQAIWTWLDPNGKSSRSLRYEVDGQDRMEITRAPKLLEAKYEVDRYHDHLSHMFQETFVKYELFNHEWGEIYIKPEPYIDTYFSLVTETIFEYPYSFRTEKIWKPIAIGHPWIAVANRGYYRDLRDLGFKTFNHVIDESFDLVDDNQSRIRRIADLVRDLCRSNLGSFLLACEDTCKYNQQHLLELRPQIRQDFPDRFFQFLKQYRWMT